MKTLSIGNLPVGRHPRVVGTVLSLQALERAARLKERSFDILEVRADAMPERAEAVRRASARIRSAGIPILLTIRSAREGGAWRGGEARRRERYLAHLDEVDAVDVEIRSALMRPVARAARRRGKMVMGSFHDFTRTPRLDALRRIIAQGRAAGAQIVKIAVFLRRPGDIARLIRLLQGSGDGRLCVVGLGPLGATARITLVGAGSCLTYGYVDRPAAPGQPSCRELAARWRREYPGLAADRRAK